MAHIDNLIASIPDPALRDALEAEVRKLHENRQYGLVFNEHEPESVLLHKQSKVRLGDKVQVMVAGTHDRTFVDDTGIWVVTAATNNNTVRLALKADPQLTREEPRERCVAVREFGDPIYPGLRSTGRVDCGGDKPPHIVVNGENFHALQALRYPYARKVDAIYIDPPYNTGARDWKYNNDYVDDTDPYRHSKWLSFIQKRLELAKDLLNPTSSVLIVTIDEKEVHPLGLLIDQVFQGQRTQMVTIVINPNGVARKSELARVEEYAFFVFIGDASPVPVSDAMLDQGSAKTRSTDHVRWEWLLRGGSNSRRQDRPNLFYPIYLDPDTRTVKDVGEPLPPDQTHDTVPPRAGLVTVWPLRTNGDEGNWRASGAYFKALLATGHARVGAYDRSNDRWSMLYLGKAQIRRIEDGTIEVIGRRDDGSLILASKPAESSRTAKTVWNRPAHKAGEYGSALLKKFIPDRPFTYPKSLYAVEDALRVAIGDKPQALVVDFFAGSGTTAHAVMRLNHQDGGTRKTILVTNNEVSPEEAAQMRTQGVVPGADAWEALGICEHVTVPRLRAAITGCDTLGRPVKGDYAFEDPFPMAEGFEENAEFFELTYEDPNLVSTGRKFHAVAPLLWLMAGGRGTRIDEIDRQTGWSLPATATYGVLFKPSEWSDFVKAVNERAESDLAVTHLFVFTNAPAEYQQVVSKVPPGVVTQRLYRNFLHSFEINTG